MADEIIKLIKYLKNEPLVQEIFALGSVLGICSIIFIVIIFVKVFNDIFRRK